MIRLLSSLAATLAVVAALAGLSWAVVAADRSEARATAVRLALWRLDAQANTLVLSETALPLARWQHLAMTPPVQQRLFVGTGTVAQLQDAVQEKAASPATIIAGASRFAQDSKLGKDAQEYVQRAQNAVQLKNLSAERDPTAAGVPVLTWEGDALLLDRPLAGGGLARTRIDWPRWRQDLLSAIEDLLPSAQLRPVQPGDTDLLASLPLALDAGPLAAPMSATTWWLLGGAWVAGLGGLGAVLAALTAAARLAERRAAFVSAVTHELRTPLTALRLHGDLLADARIADDPLRRAAPVLAIRDGAARLAHLIDNVLDYARLERRRPPSPRPVRLDHLVAELENTLPGVDIAPLPAVTVRADPQAVERILANLADNARKYGRPPFTLTVAAGPRRVTLTLTDHGPGLAPDARARLFTPFARSAEAAAGDAPGVGLGLALCRRLAQAQGGDLSVDDAPGGGVRAVLTLRPG
jgi:signal transduction histidine kinase